MLERDVQPENTLKSASVVMEDEIFTDCRFMQFAMELGSVVIELLEKSSVPERFAQT